MQLSWNSIACISKKVQASYLSQATSIGKGSVKAVTRTWVFLSIKPYARKQTEGKGCWLKITHNVYLAWFLYVMSGKKLFSAVKVTSYID